MRRVRELILEKYSIVDGVVLEYGIYYYDVISIFVF